jgi:hypothetical protein
MEQRAPRLGRDGVLAVVGAQLGLRQPRVHLDLVDRGHRPGLLREPLQVRDLEVGHADRPRATVGEHAAPGPSTPARMVVLGRGQWMRNRSTRSVPRRSRLSSSAATGRRAAVLQLVVMNTSPRAAGLRTACPTPPRCGTLRGVDVAVALERRAHGLGRALGGTWKHAEADWGSRHRCSNARSERRPCRRPTRRSRRQKCAVRNPRSGRTPRRRRRPGRVRRGRPRPAGGVEHVAPDGADGAGGSRPRRPRAPRAGPRLPGHTARGREPAGQRGQHRDPGRGRRPGRG